MGKVSDKVLTLRELEGSGSFKSELLSVWLCKSLGVTESCRNGSNLVRASYVDGVTSDVGDTWLGGSSKAKGGSRWLCSWSVLALVLLLFWWDVCLFWDQVKDAFFEFH